MFDKSEKFSLPELEKKVLEFWKTDNTFEKSLKKTGKGREFVFYEGPPTANGRPGIHHLLARAFKDVIPRYKTMKGFHVPRRGGWDTHGLPVEIEVEKQLGLKSKKEIEKYGIAEFNKKCKESVWKYKDEWERLTERMGFWLDMKNPYITYTNEYISVVWQIVREAWRKGLLYKGYKVLPWCTRCGTALSSHELAQGYRKVKENSVFLKFKVKSEKFKDGTPVPPNTYILSWTTTPWTLPGNVALAVGDGVKYVLTEKNGENYILAESRMVILENAGALKEIKSGVVDLEYEPLFKIPELKSEKSYKVYSADFVTTTDGTGVVHTAVMYGEDDYNLGKKEDLPQFHTVTVDGRFIESVPEVGGMKVKIPESDTKIVEYLKKNGNYLKEEKIEHDYPFCWRCDTPLLYYARSSWFIKMSELRENLIKENAKINWIPEHMRDGRFGEWLREVKDWAISRERYWGTPLPLWECGKCGKQKFVAEEKDFEDMKTGKNTYILCRHGEAESNVGDFLSCYPEKRTVHLTERGKEMARTAGEKLKKEKIDIIIASDILRAKETAEIISKIVGVPVTSDERLRELNLGDLNGKSEDEYRVWFTGQVTDFVKPFPNGESHRDVHVRTNDFFKDMESRYAGKTILVVSHEYSLWALDSVMKGWTEYEVERKEDFQKRRFFQFATPKKILHKPGPRDEFGAIDFHKPYIDDVKFVCAHSTGSGQACGGEMSRTPEVLDVWFDSGSMPWASQVENLKPKDKNIKYPADYIAEAVDQTRGWFYTLLAVGTFLGEGSPYRNVISLGHILDKSGQKMSKSKGNIVDPWEMMDKYGSDVIRWHFYTVNPPGESKKFDEQELVKVSRAVFMILYNSYAFWDLYADKSSAERLKHPAHVLDRWILARLDQTSNDVTELLDKYEIGKAAKSVQELIDDLSRWYIRRSRRRFQKPERNKDFKEASQTLGFILSETAKLMAPFAPFFAEALYKSVNAKKESIHLSEWAKIEKLKADSKKLIEEMEEVRNVASTVLAKRAESGIKVRQPLKELKIKSEKIKDLDIIEILKDEINVKEVKTGADIKEEILLDTEITPELKEDGMLREILRAMQEYRQEKGLVPKDKVPMHISGNKETLELIKKNEEKLLGEANASEFSFEKKEGELKIS